MARIRTVKPEFWTDDRVGECSVSARLLFIAMWNFADDHGGLDRSAKQLKAQAFPYDTIDCEPLVGELLKAGLVVEYEAEGRKYLHIKGFGVHQKIEKRGKPRVPIYESSPTPPRIVGEPSPLEGKGREIEGNGYKKRAKVGKEFPPDFVLDDSLRQKVLQRFGDCDVDRAFEAFKSHHLARGSRFKNWGAAWTTWVGNFDAFGYPKRVFTSGAQWQ